MRVVDLPLPLLGRPDTVDSHQALESFRTEDAGKVGGDRIPRLPAHDQPCSGRVVVFLGLDQAAPFKRVRGPAQAGYRRGVPRRGAHPHPFAWMRVHQLQHLTASFAQSTAHGNLLNVS